jgi:DNA-binding NarL/FixJ family response regulator
MTASPRRVAEHADPASGETIRMIGLVVEDLAEIREWLCECLRRAFEGMIVTGAANLHDARGWLSAYEKEGEGEGRLIIALIDIRLPDGSGMDLIRYIAGRHPATLPVVTTIYDDDAHIFEAIAGGARGYLLKDIEEDLLIDYLRRIERGEPPLSPSIAQRILAHFRETPSEAMESDGLSPREVEVLALLSKGMTVAETARQLGLKPQTVASYVKVIYQKLNISTRAEATREAIRRGLA